MPIIRSLRLYLCYYCIRCVMPWLIFVPPFMSICTDLSLIEEDFVLSDALFLSFLCFSLFWYTHQVCSNHSQLPSILQVPVPISAHLPAFLTGFSCSVFLHRRRFQRQRICTARNFPSHSTLPFDSLRNPNSVMT